MTTVADFFPIELTVSRVVAWSGRDDIEIQRPRNRNKNSNIKKVSQHKTSSYAVKTSDEPD